MGTFLDILHALVKTVLAEKDVRARIMYYIYYIILYYIYIYILLRLVVTTILLRLEWYIVTTNCMHPCVRNTFEPIQLHPLRSEPNKGGTDR